MNPLPNETGDSRIEGPNLPELPAELLLDIADHLNPVETAALALTSRELLAKLGTRVLHPPLLGQPDRLKLMCFISSAGDFLPKIFCLHCRSVHLHLPAGSNSTSDSNGNSSSWRILPVPGKFGFKTGIDLRLVDGDNPTCTNKPPCYLSGAVDIPNYGRRLHVNEVLTVMASYRRWLLLASTEANQSPGIPPTLRMNTPTESIDIQALLSGLCHFDKVQIEINRRDDEGNIQVQAMAKIHRYFTYRIVNGNLLSKTETFIYPIPAGSAARGALYHAPAKTHRFNQTTNKWVYANQIADAALNPYQRAVKKLSDIFHGRALEPGVSQLARERFGRLRKSCAHHDWVSTFPGLFNDFPTPRSEVPPANENRGILFFDRPYDTRRYTYGKSTVFGGRVCESCMGYTDNLCRFVEIPEEMFEAEEGPVQPPNSKKMRGADTHPREQAKTGKGKPATRVLVLTSYQNFGPGRSPEDPQWKGLFGSYDMLLVQVFQRMMPQSTNHYGRWLPKIFSFASPWEQFESASGAIHSDSDSCTWTFDPNKAVRDYDERLWRETWRYPDHQRSGWRDTNQTKEEIKSTAQLRTLGELGGMERRAWSLTTGCNLRAPVIDRTKLERLVRNDDPM